MKLNLIFKAYEIHELLIRPYAFVVFDFETRDTSIDSWDYVTTYPEARYKSWLLARSLAKLSGVSQGIIVYKHYEDTERQKIAWKGVVEVKKQIAFFARKL